MLASIDAIGVGDADMPDAFRRLYERRFGRRVGTGYGLTEVMRLWMSSGVLEGRGGW